MAKKLSAKEFKQIQEQTNSYQNQAIELAKEELASLNSIFDTSKRIALQEQIINSEKQKHLNNANLITKAQQQGYKLHGNTLNNIKKERQEAEKINKSLEKKLSIQKAVLSSLGDGLKMAKSATGSILGYLMESDKAMKGVSLELGLSGERAAQLNKGFEGAAGFAASMGVDMAGLAQMTSVFAEETGRARLHSEANLKSLTAMAKGTSLGIEGAARMAGQYEAIGFNATDSATEIQRIVDTTERMGVNTGKVLKAVNKNFKTMQKYTFKGGSQGMADMAIYAEKFKINMDEVLSSMEKGRSLDSVIEMSAQLQVLGGQFANLADPMAMLFESRNDPKAYTKRINEMTKGMVAMNKTANGFEFQIASPMAQDQLAAAAKALGMTTDELTIQAFKSREIAQTRSQMFSKGFTNKEKEIIEGLAQFDKKTGKMMVEVGGVATDVSKLSSNQVKALYQQKITLEERAKASQSFDEAFKNTVMQLKATMLPLLKGINGILETVRPVVESLINTFDKSGPVLKGLMLFGGLFAASVAKLLYSKATNGLSSLLGGGGAKGIASNMGGGAKGLTDTVSGGAKGAGKHAGKGLMKGGAGVGAAALGMGAGIGLAATGLAELAKAMKDMPIEALNAFQNIAIALAISLPLMALGVAALGATATAAALGLLAFGGAVLMVGAGIGLAAAGIGYMAEGMSSLDGVDLSGAATGMLGIGAASLMMANPLTILGIGAMTAGVIAIGANANNMEKVGNAFHNIGAVLKGSSSQFKEIRDTVNSIADADIGGIGMMAQLSSLLSKPLKVEFADKEIGFVANIDLTMGSEKFITQISKKIPARIVDLQQAKA